MAKNEDIGQKKKSPLKIVGNVLSYALIFFLAACVLLIAYSAITNGTGNGLTLGPYKLVTVLSGSMDPALGIGSLAIAREVPEEDLSVGDIVTYRPLEGSNTLVTHRITAIEVMAGKNSFITKGDNNNTPDSDPVYYSDIVGEIVLSIPLVGYVFYYIKTPLGILAVIAIIAAYHIIRILIKSKKGETNHGKNHEKSA